MYMYLATLSSSQHHIREFNVGIFPSRKDAEQALTKRYTLEYFKSGGIEAFEGTIYKLKVGHTYIGGDYNRPEHPCLSIDAKYLKE